MKGVGEDRKEGYREEGESETKGERGQKEIQERKVEEGGRKRGSERCRGREWGRFVFCFFYSLTSFELFKTNIFSIVRIFYE